MEHNVQCKLCSAYEKSNRAAFKIISFLDLSITGDPRRTSLKLVYNLSSINKCNYLHVTPMLSQTLLY